MPRSIYRNAVILAALPVLFSAPHKANAQDAYFPNNADIKSAIKGKVYIGYANDKDYSQSQNGTSPNVNFLEGANVTIGVDVWNNSKLTVSGGQIGVASGATLSAYGHSIVIIRGGRIVNLNVSSHSRIDLRGGRIGNTIVVDENGTLNVFGTGLSKKVTKTSPTSTHYTLSGKLADGSVLHDIHLEVGTGKGASPKVNFLSASTASQP